MQLYKLIFLSLVLVTSASMTMAETKVKMETTEIRGNRELPNVLYIVPWKQPPVGELVGKPIESLLDEVLAPLDREVFKREIEYYDWLEKRRKIGIR
jgi:hypothetical protein